ncbi:MAG: C-terminal target protein [Bacteroidetes bacterium]|nr:C-terminal target protein [Bacteroidota bacterium]
MKKTIFLLYSSFILSSSLSAQSFQWAQREGDDSNGYTICTDNTGNSYVYGRIFMSTTIGGQSLNMANGDHFIAKYDNTGSSIWVKQLDSMEVSDLDCNSTDLFVTGRFHTGASFDGTAVTGSGTTSWDGYIARVSAGGTLNWVKTITNPTTYETANSVSIDNSGNAYIAGTFSGSSAMIGSTTITGSGGESMFLLKLAPDGSILWSKTSSANPGGSVQGNRIEVSTLGDIYVMSTADGDTAHYDGIPYFAGSYPAELLLHYNVAGTLMDMAEINHSYQDNVTAMTVDAGGNVYTLQTNYLTSFTLSKFNAALDTLWMTTDGTGGHLSVTDVEVTPAGQVIVAGHVSEDATFGGVNTVYNSGGQPGFLAYYTSGGSYSSLTEIPGSLYMGQIGLDALENVYMTGAVADTASFGTVDLTTTGSEAMFLAKYGISTGIASAEKGSISVYPNPCAGKLNCALEALPGTSAVALYNTLGEKVYEEAAATGLLQIDLSGYEKGIYLLNVSNGGSVLTKKIVVN